MKLTLTILSVLLLTACTITKRHFEPGYHVEWKRTLQTEKAKDIPNKPNDLKCDVPETHTAISAMEPEIFEVASPVDSFNVHEVNPVDQDQALPVSDDGKRMRKPEPGVHPEQVIALRKLSDDEFPVEQEKQRVEPFTWAALAALFLAGMVVLLFFAASIIDYILIFALALGVVFIVFSFVSVTHIAKNPSKYKAKGLSWILFGLSAAILGVVSFGMILGAIQQIF